MSFLGEIKRRKVFQVAAVYLVVAWLIVQVVDVVNEPLSLPDWFDTVVILLLAIGFPIALILSWAFDLTPEGLIRDEGRTTQTSGRQGDEVELRRAGLWKAFDSKVEFFGALTSYAAELCTGSARGGDP